MPLDLEVAEGDVAEAEAVADSAFGVSEDSMVWWPFSPGDPVGEDESEDLVVVIGVELVDGPGLPDDEPVGLLLDDVSNTVFVPAMVVPALALAELGSRAAEEGDMEVGPPVGEEVVATEEAAFAGTNPAIGSIRPQKREQMMTYQHDSDQYRRQRRRSSGRCPLRAKHQAQQDIRIYY
jgi:hypothetical protein